MKSGGEYIFAPDRIITAEVPVENVLAMYEAMDGIIDFS